MTYPCPYCLTPADLDRGCPGCGRGPDRDAAEVIRLDAEIPMLTVRLREAREAVVVADGRLRDAQLRRNAAAARVSTALLAHPAAPGPAGPAAPGPAGPAAPGAAARRTAEASARLVQNALFVLGGLLLCVAAIVFTAVAWAQFGIAGRAALLLGFTAVTLAVPPLVLRRGLAATAETFAAVGLLLVLLDGYAAWSVDLFGVAHGSAAGYAGAICATTAAVAAGYEALTGLRGPRVAALAVAQPVLPLVVAPFHPSATGWSLALAAVAALDVAVVHRRRRNLGSFGVALRALGYALGAAAAFGSGVCAMSALGTATGPAGAAGGGVALVIAAGVVLVATLSVRSPIAQAGAGALLVLSFALAAGRTAALAGGRSAAVLVALVEGALAVAVVGTGRRLPPAVRRGPWIGALLAVGLPAVVALGGALRAAVTAVRAARPLLGADPAAAAGHAGWQLPVTVALLVGGLVVLLPASRRIVAASCGAALVALAVPAGLGWPWWAAPGIDLAVAATILWLTVRIAAPALPGTALPGTALPGTALPGTVAGLLVIHAVLAGLGTPATAAATFGAVALLGLGLAAWAHILRTRDEANERPAGGLRLSLGGMSLAVGLLALPAGAWSGAAALDVSAPWRTRAALVTLALLTAAARLIARRWAAYGGPAAAAVALAAATVPLWTVRFVVAPGGDSAGESSAVYAAVALILLALLPETVSALPAAVAAGSRVSPAGSGRAGARDATTGAVVASRGVALAALPVGLALLAAIAMSLAAVLFGPYAWLAHAWSGRPAGTGLSVSWAGRVPWGDAFAVVLLAGALAAYRWTRGHRWGVAARAAGPALALAAPLMLASADVRWPAVPAASLLGGLIVAVFLAFRHPAAERPAGDDVTGVHPPEAHHAGTGLASVGVAGSGAASAGLVASGLVAAGLVASGLVAAGLAGALATRAGTLAALAVVGVAGASAGAAGRQVSARITGWVVAVAAFVGFAFALGRAGGLTPAGAAFGVLAVAAAALAGGTALVARRRVEAVAVQAAAHAGAVTALLLTAGSARYAAAVCTLWGVVCGVRALRRGESAARRGTLVVAAAAAELAGWWLLIAAAQVSLTEAYTLPAAGVALLAGWWRRRAPGDGGAVPGSWPAYGPALAAALLPTCATVLVGPGEPWRRLSLGLGALALVLLGARFRLRAPVVGGGAALAVLALHEAMVFWDLLPRWIPLAGAGLLLVTVAMTLERRRRDLHRLRGAVARMT